ncbi:hypothetical protein FHR75_000412 [Kineococcus radiotolerans]|uniref:Uncharacterized protein n=1 Tax=Kineococcus radiotolerans TaxID=131568 RepID=A0A7W4TIN4_KINRA|nr:hypothetical protein [Kineococcus radiotolerans]
MNDSTTNDSTDVVIDVRSLELTTVANPRRTQL